MKGYFLSPWSKTGHVPFDSHPSQFIIHNHPPIHHCVICTIEKVTLNELRTTTHTRKTLVE
jgi:hypothetical protein